MRCNCETTLCMVRHAEAECRNRATVACGFIGAVCAECADYTPARYLGVRKPEGLNPEDCFYCGQPLDVNGDGHSNDCETWERETERL